MINAIVEVKKACAIENEKIGLLTKIQKMPLLQLAIKFWLANIGTIL